MSEDQIVQRCREGQRDAQRQLYAQTADRVYRVLLRITRDPDDAFDLAQETYLRVFRRIGQFDGRCRLMTWVYRIAVNEGLQFLRQKKRHDAALRERIENPPMEPNVTTIDARMDLEEALARLSATDRALIVLRHFEELTYAEIEEVLEKPSGTIASGLSRARQALRELLEGTSIERG